MSKYDLLNNYNLDHADRKYDEFYIYPATDVTPYMCFSTVLTLVDNITASVSINQYRHSVHFYNLFGENIVQVIFDNSSDDCRITLFDPYGSDENDIKCYNSIDDISDEECASKNITRENLVVLELLSAQIIEKLKKDETLKKSVL